jgi:hypothetical protein
MRRGSWQRFGCYDDRDVIAAMLARISVERSNLNFVDLPSALEKHKVDVEPWATIPSREGGHLFTNLPGSKARVFVIGAHQVAFAESLDVREVSWVLRRVEVSCHDRVQAIIWQLFDHPLSLSMVRVPHRFGSHRPEGNEAEPRWPFYHRRDDERLRGLALLNMEGSASEDGYSSSVLALLSLTRPTVLFVNELLGAGSDFLDAEDMSSQRFDGIPLIHNPRLAIPRRDPHTLDIGTFDPCA